MKVFGTGLQRTGTTSLTRALNMIGVPTRQFPKQLYHDLHHPIIDRFDGFTDFPIPLLFEALDQAYPGSRFIHSVRDERSWLASVRWLFRTGSWKFSWNHMPVVHAFHERFYGTTTFDEERFLARYRAYNQQVVEYFRERPADFLLLRLGAGDEFARLCPFLGRDIPAAPYPRLNRQETPASVLARKLWMRLRSAWLLRNRGGA